MSSKNVWFGRVRPRRRAASLFSRFAISLGKLLPPQSIRIAACCVFSIAATRWASGQEQPDIAPKSTPAEFTNGETEPRIDLKANPEAREILEVAHLTSAAAQAFDRGDSEGGKNLMRQAVQKLAALEQVELRRKNRAGRSKLAAQRARLQLEFLGDVAAAKEAFLAAVESDERNEEAQRSLVEIFAREEAGQVGRADR